MLQIVYYSRRGQFLDHLRSLSQPVKLIAPSPGKADSLRSQLTRDGLNADVVTIAKFTSSLIEKLWEGRELPSIKRKAELLLTFSILKNRYFPEMGFEQFMQGYNLFSELRSFSVDVGPLQSILEEESPEISKVVTLFWKILELTGDLDEHGAYHLLSQELRSSEDIEELRGSYVFHGFQHLNGQQVDLLKALSIRYDVIIPFPLELKDSLRSSDWISWVKDEKCDEIILSGEASRPKADWVMVNSREISKTLKGLLKPSDQVVLGVSKLSPLHLDLLPVAKSSLKIPELLLDSDLLALSSEIKEKFSGVFALDDLGLFLKESLAEILNKKRMNYLRLKSLQLYSEALQTIKDLTDEEVRGDQFLLRVLQVITNLNQPRTSLTTSFEGEAEVTLRDFSLLEDISSEERVLICIDERFEDLMGLGQRFAPHVQKILATLGPMKRGDLDLSFKIWEFTDLCDRAPVTVLLSPSTLKHSLIWKKIFSGIELIPLNSDLSHSRAAIEDHFSSLELRKFEGSFSASKFQSYMDCPRKFYLSYVEKLFPEVKVEQDFDALDGGSISHRIIELFVNRRLDLTELPKLVKEVMAEKISERSLRLNRETYLKRELEFTHRAKNGIDFLSQLSHSLQEDFTWVMEKDFSSETDFTLRGKIDCLGQGKSVNLLLDFKSTSSGVPSKKDIFEMENLQLWTYVRSLSETDPEFLKKDLIMGFVSLDEPKKSLLLFTSEDMARDFKAQKICSSDSFEEFSDLLKKSHEKMQELVLSIQNDKLFAALPNSVQACTFCELSRICVKGGALA